MTTLNLMKMAESSLKWWKTLGKGEIASFFMVFSEEFYCRHVKNQGLFGKGLSDNRDEMLIVSGGHHRRSQSYENNLTFSPKIAQLITQSRANRLCL